MANFGVMKITNLGMDLYTKIQTGSLIQFTKIQSGDGVLPGGTNIEELTALISPKFDVSIESFQVDTENHNVRIKGTKTNDGLLEGNFSREIGLFAIDPDIGEILYAYANAGEYPDYIPPISTGPYSKTFVINAAIGNATNVTAIVPTDIYVTKESFDLFKSEIDTQVTDFVNETTQTLTTFEQSVNASLEGKAQTNHATSATTYGVGTTANYGHVKTIDALTQATHVNGTALSARQGYILDQNKIATSQKGVVNGVATLNSSGAIPSSQLINASKIVKGTFTGDGSATARTINVGFDADIIIFMGAFNTTTGSIAYIFKGFTNPMVNGLENTQGIIVPTTNGFIVNAENSSGAYYNVLNKRYEWIAINLDCN